MRANRAGKRKNALGGPRKSLIRLDSDKEIQASPLVGFGGAWLDLAQFGPIWIPLGFSLDVMRYTSAPRTSSVRSAAPPLAPSPSTDLIRDQGRLSRCRASRGSFRREGRGMA